MSTGPHELAPELTLQDFEQLSADYDLIPVWLEVEADLETPITAFWKLRDGKTSFLFESVEGGETWARYTFMGTAPKRTFVVNGTTLTTIDSTGQRSAESFDDPLDALHRRVASGRVYRPPGLPRFYGGLVGGISYDVVSHWERRSSALERRVPDLMFFETDVILAWDNLKHRALLIALTRVNSSQSPAIIYQRARVKLEDARAKVLGPLPSLPRSSTGPQEIVRSVEDAEFERRIARAKNYIEAGDAIQVVLSREFLQPSGDTHPFLVYRTLRSLNPSPYMFYLETPDLSLVGASPEVLVRKTGQRIDVRPIAGTRPRGQTPDEDTALEQELRRDPKECAEHVMLVDLARNDVGRVAQTGSVIVQDQMIVERYSHVMHLVSHVCGEMRSDLSLTNLLVSTFPAGTLSGAPKRRAMEIIRELEGDARGYYGGAIGVISPDGDLDLCIAIRMMTSMDGVFSVRAGAGVVFDSIPAKESEETVNKARAILTAIERARERFGGAAS